MRLFIAEKPSLAKAIFEGLGGNPATEKKNGYFQHGNDVVTWCFGHMLEIFDPEDYDAKYEKWNLQDLAIPSYFPPKYKLKPESLKQTKIVLDLIKNSESIVNCGDPDEEGCRLVDEILEYIECKKPVMRLLVADLNLAPVKKSLANMQPNENFRGMSNSALARSILDQSFGYNLTRACTLKGRENGFSGLLSVGRVQSAVLGLVNLRTLANLNHAESFYYDIYANITIAENSVKAKYCPVESDQVDEKNRIISEAQAKHISERIENVTAVVTVATTKPEITKAPLPLNLSTLQQICAKRFGYKAKKTLEIMQGLYETHKLLTYPRSDNRYLSDEHYYQSKDIVNAIQSVLPDMVNISESMDFSQKHKAFDASKIEAHHAIVPTTKSGKGINLTNHELNVYNVVATYFIGLFLPDAIRNKTKIHFDIGGDTFSATQSVLVQKGWQSLGKDEEADQDDEEELNNFDLTALKFSDKGFCESGTTDKKKALPPKYFTESSLLAAMTRAAKFIDDPVLRKSLEAKDEGSTDRGSIGTEATRAGILDKLASNTGLISIEKEKGYSELVWKTTTQGQEFCQALPAEIIKPDISAIWAEQQKKIKDGSLTVESFIRETDKYIAEIINRIKSDGLSISSNAPECPSCHKGELRKRSGKNGLFWACSCYPDCKATFQDKNGQPVTEKPQDKPKSVLSCPSCSARLAVGAKAVNCTGNCGFVLWRTVSGKELTESQIESLVTKKSTGFIAGFVSKKGEKYTAKLHLTDDFKIKFEYKPK